MESHQWQSNMSEKKHNRSNLKLFNKYLHFIYKAQKKHLFNLNNAKPAIDTRPPKKFLRSYLNNKYENRINFLIL